MAVARTGAQVRKNFHQRLALHACDRARREAHLALAVLVEHPFLQQLVEHFRLLFIPRLIHHVFNRLHPLLAVLKDELHDLVEAEQLGETALKDDLDEAGLTALPAGTLVYEINGPMFFGAIENLERVLLQTHTDPQLLILRLRRVPFMDITGIQSLQSVLETLRKRGVRVILCEANPRVLSKLKTAQVIGDADPNYRELFAETLGSDLLTEKAVPNQVQPIP